MESFKFLGIHIADKLKWSTDTDRVVKKVQQSLFNLRRLKQFVLSPKTLTNLYIYTKSILPGCITAWYGNCNARNHKALSGANYRPPGHLQHPISQEGQKDLQGHRLRHCLFTQMSSRRRGQYRCIKAGTERLKNSFYLKAIRLLNSHH